MVLLLVEDDALTREEMTEGLEAEGFSVRAAPDGHAALDLLREAADHPEAAPEALVTDLDLGRDGPDGLALAALARAMVRPDLPVLVVSSRPRVRLDGPGLAAGAEAALAKPVAPGQVARALRRLLDAARAGAAGSGAGGAGASPRAGSSGPAPAGAFG